MNNSGCVEEEEELQRLSLDLPLVGASGTLERIDAAAERITDVERRMSRLEMYMGRCQQGPVAL